MTIPNAHNLSSSPRPSLAELSRRATVDKSDLAKYSIKTWISSVNKLFEQVSELLLCQAIYIVH